MRYQKSKHFESDDPIMIALRKVQVSEVRDNSSQRLFLLPSRRDHLQEHIDQIIE
ncbi:MAG: hypothetical protein OXC92_10090 [Flavobacteriaceae bacterium]|nr:hypothetical protein [Flavobacteriaceae bacterium]